jgi:guanosine-3',5'-bis(diphosphate) 3'-pyrophosphohydrolase
MNTRAESFISIVRPENVDDKNLLQFCEQRFKREDLEKIKSAYAIAEEAHKGVQRDTGGDYFLHPVNVAVILIKELKYSKDWRVIAAALLHDTLEDTNVWGSRDVPDNELVISALTKIDDTFKDEELSDWLMALTKLKRRNRNNPTTFSEKDVYIGQLVKFPVAVLVKGADRLHNLRTMSEDREKVIKYIRDTEEYILPCLEFCVKGNGATLNKAIEVCIGLIEKEISTLKEKYSINN